MREARGEDAVSLLAPITVSHGRYSLDGRVKKLHAGKFFFF